MQDQIHLSSLDVTECGNPSCCKLPRYLNMAGATRDEDPEKFEEQSADEQTSDQGCDEGRRGLNTFKLITFCTVKLDWTKEKWRKFST